MSRASKSASVQRLPPIAPKRGQVWWADLGEPIGHEQGFGRPFLILSTAQLNEGFANLVIGVPISSKDHEQPWHTRVEPPEADLTELSWIQPECIRSISRQRLRKPRGFVSAGTLAQVEDMVRILLEM